jgi:hypothetical protein
MASAFRIDFTAQNSDGYPGGSEILNRLMGKVSAAFARIERLMGLPNGIAPLDADGLIPAQFLANGFALTPSNLHVTGTAAANTAVTVTLPAVPGKSHFITSIQLVRVASGIVGAGAALIHTSTNLPGNPAWDAGNAIAAGQAIIDLDYRPTTPLQSLAPGVATTITMPAAGLTAINRINCSYFVQ